jgi:putative secretion ATPase (PEP-CTERM system associated)
MYETYYGLSAKPFQLRPDPHFFFGSKGHKRAMAYLEYGLSQGEGFIVITGEVGAGKTTLVRNLFNRMPKDRIVAAHVVNTRLDAEDALRSVAAAFGLQTEGATKAELLARLERFLRITDQQGKRALLVVDEAQNLSAGTIEELRMLSNFQTDSHCLLQTFLLGQPEFRATVNSPGMQQLRQRVTASYHLGPMDAEETRAYIEHRLQTVGWKGDPAFSSDAHAAIYAYSGGIPRKTNTLCDRILLMGYLEELHAFGAAEVATVVQDISDEFDLPLEAAATAPVAPVAPVAAAPQPDAPSVDERMSRLESSVFSVLSLLKNMVSAPRSALAHPGDGSK